MTHYGIILDTTSLIDIKKCKLGFILIKENEESDISYVHRVLENKLETKKDIFFSNEFEFGNKTSYGIQSGQKN